MIVCAAVILINLTNLPWNAKDKRIISRAAYVCANDNRHAPEFPCLKSLTKEPGQHYSVICGEQK